MNRASPLSVDRIPLVGGRLCLDFVNTGDRKAGLPRERLATYDDLLVWSRRAWVFGKHEERVLAAEARRRPADAQAALESARRARELLSRLFTSMIERRTPAETEMAGLNRLLVAAASRRGLAATARGIRWRWQAGRAELDRMVWPVVQSAADLLVSTDLPRLKRCGECDWLFLDGSKNGSRRWCKKSCGDRVKSRRYHRRRRGGET